MIYISLYYKSPDNYWSTLTSETAFLARVFVDHCIASDDHNRLEAALPVVTALAFHIQETYNAIQEDVAKQEEEQAVGVIVDEELRHKREDERIEREFVVGELLGLAVGLDYSDEIGRRKMFALVRKWSPYLPTRSSYRHTLAENNITDEFRAAHRRYDVTGTAPRDSSVKVSGCAQETVGE